MIFFDLDGTLLDDVRATACGLEALCAEFGDAIEAPRADHAKRWQELYEQHFARFVRGELTLEQQRRARLRGFVRSDHPAIQHDDDVDAVYAKYLAAYRGGWTRYEDALPCLEALVGTPLGVISNGEQRQQMQKLEAAGLAKFFSVVITASEIGAKKPDARIFAEACRRGGAEAAECVYVGDDYELDAIASKACGFRAVWVRRAGAREPANRDSAIAVVDSLIELPPIVSPR